MLPTPPPLSRDIALFLDLDGSLLELAPTPQSVVVPEDLATLLSGLRRCFDGALAIVSGRPIEQIDQLLHPLCATSAGLHGGEYRWPGSRQVERAEAGDLHLIAQALRQRFAQQPAIEIEDKGLAIALHFRNAPESAADCQTAMEDVTRGRNELRLLSGHSVIEALPVGINKGDAIRQLMLRPPFAGRRPCFIGDDVTDEQGFVVVNALEGISVKVGAQATQAHHALKGPHAVLEWLRFSFGLLQSENGDSPES